MGKRQRRLAQLLGDEPITLPVPRDADVLASSYADVIRRTYVDLGGIQTRDALRTRIGKWDVQYQGTAIELDEEQHFNRYREQTLGPHSYEKLPSFPLYTYRTYCVKHEGKVRAHGKFWATPSADKQFDKANVEGDLTGKSSSRWKQRAFYDFIKDLAPLLLGFNVVRIAIWDTLSVAGQQLTVEKALKNPDGSVRSAVIELIEQRSYEMLPPKT